MKKDKFFFGLKTQIFFGEDCVRENGALLKSLGKKAIIVTGRHSAKACGALNDVRNTLLANGVQSFIFDQVENNPSMETIQKAVAMAREENPNFVIGIGGGSPLDASKAIAVMLANDGMTVPEMLTNDFDKALPIVAIPTTAGTGSEATPYSVILRNDIQTKVSFGNSYTYSTFAFVDPKYTYNLNERITVSTCVDAFTHVFEGYLANRSTPISDCMAICGIEIFGRIIKKLVVFNLTEEDRKSMALLSLLGGMVIAQAGVTIPHGMGYCYTYYKGIPHGLANGLIFKEYLKLNSSVAQEKINRAMSVMGYQTTDDFLRDFHLLVGEPPKLTEEECETFIRQTMLQKGSIANTPYPVDEKVIRKLWTHIK